MGKIFGLAMCHIALTSTDKKHLIINKSDEYQEIRARTNFYPDIIPVSENTHLLKKVSHRNLLSKTFIFVAVTV